MNKNPYKRLVKSILITVLIVFIALALRLVWPINLLGERVPYLTFYPAIMLASIYGGLYIGLLATCLSSFSIYFSELIGYTFIHDNTDFLALFIFSFNGILFAIIGEVMQCLLIRQEAALAKARRLANALDTVSAYVYIKDNHSCYIYANKATLELFHCSDQELHGKDDSQFYPTETAKQLLEADKRILMHGESIAEEITLIDEKGDFHYYWEIKTPLMDERNHHKIWGLCGISTDITGPKLQDAKLRESEERFRSTFDSAAIGMAIVSTEGQFIQVNPALAQLLGHTQAELQAKTFQDITYPDDLNTDLALMTQVLRGERDSYKIEKRYFHKDGSVIWIFLSVSVVHDDDNHIKYLISQIIDITERKLFLDTLEKQAHQDYLTGLYNRRFFLEQGEIEFSRAKRFNLPLCVLMLDVDYFKKVNDRYGHKVGDLVLQHISNMLRITLRNMDIIGRMGGEEIAIILPNSNLDDSILAAERLRKVIEETPFILKSDVQIYHTISIGMAILKNTPHENIESLINEADMALYQAKKAGRNQVVIND